MKYRTAQRSSRVSYLGNALLQVRTQYFSQLKLLWVPTIPPPKNNSGS